MIKNLFLGLTLGVSLAQGMLPEAVPLPAPVVSYTDLANHTSAFWQPFTAIKHEQRLLLLYQLGALTHENTTQFIITDVPALQAGTSTALRVTITFTQYRLEIRLFDAAGNECLEGSTELDSRWASLDTLNTNSKNEQRRLVSGNTVMAVWEHICVLCGFDAAEICDGSVCNGFDLRVLLPYVSGHSWYGKFGYFPKKLLLCEYKQKLTFLAQRSCSSILVDFADNALVSILLRLSLGACQLPENAPLGALVKKLYHGMRAGDSHSGVLLRCVYTHFLSNYSCSNSLLSRYITGEQQKVYAQKLSKYFD